MDGILPLNKDRGMTSHDAVFKCRKIFKTRKVGHSGTLDPNVDGVLPICVGRATKAVNYLMASGKVYKGEIILGFATETEDLDGAVVAKKAIKRPFSQEQINQAMAQLTGEIIQIPPMYSAVKVNGKRLYEYARAGQSVERPKRMITVDYFKQTKPSTYDAVKKQQTLYFEVGCGKGTYVRTLALDLGEILGVPAVMSGLTRLQSGGFNLKKSVTLEQLTNATPEELETYLYPLEYAFRSYPKVILTEQQWQKVQNGGFLPANIFKDKTTKILLMYGDKARALYYYDDKKDVFRSEQMLDLT